MTDIGSLRVLGAQSVPAELDVLLRAASSELQVAQAAQDAGLTTAQVSALTSPVMPKVRLLAAQPTGSVPPQLLVLVFAFLFYLSVLTFGMSIAQSVVEEKQSRVIELLVAALPVRWLLAGKVLGNTVMALGQIVVILGAGLVGATVAGQGQLVHQALGASGWFVTFFLLGFVMLACLWAVAGSLASRIEDLQATTVVMQVLVIVPFFAAIFAIDPGPMQRVLSYVPFTSPLMMPARVVLGNAAPWEPAVSARDRAGHGRGVRPDRRAAVRGLAAAHVGAAARAAGLAGEPVSAGRVDGRIGTPLTAGATRVLLLGGGELGKEVAIELQRLGAEVVVADRYADAPAMQVAHRSHVVDMLDAEALRAVLHTVRPHVVVPEIEAIATHVLAEVEASGVRVVPTARATRLTMDREGIRRLAAEELGLPTSPYRFVDSREELHAAARELGLPCVVKPVMSSSGKGQSVVRTVGGPGGGVAVTPAPVAGWPRTRTRRCG